MVVSGLFFHQSGLDDAGWGVLGVTEEGIVKANGSRNNDRDNHQGNILAFQIIPPKFDRVEVYPKK